MVGNDIDLVTMRTGVEWRGGRRLKLIKDGRKESRRGWRHGRRIRAGMGQMDG